MTREQAVALVESKWWESPNVTHEHIARAVALVDGKWWESPNVTHEHIARFQLYEDRLCMPFGVFHEAIEKALGRPVWTHEFGFGRDGLKKELDGDSPRPTMQDIIELIPEDKRIILLGGDRR